MDAKFAMRFLNLLARKKMEHLNQAERKILKDYRNALDDEMKEAIRKEIYGDGKSKNGVGE